MLASLIGIAILFFMNILVMASAYLLAFRNFRFKNALDAWIFCFLVYFAQIVAMELMLGIEARLFLWKLVILEAAILFAVWMKTRKREKVYPERENVFGLVFYDKVALFTFSILAGFALVKIGVNLVNPPFGWDSLNYHFSFPVEWLKAGNLVNPITINDDPSPPYYPINGSLFFFWLMVPLKNVFLADLGQVPFFIISFFLVYAISKKTGASRELSFFAACLFALIPNYFKQLQVAYVDMMVAVLFLGALNFLLLIKEEYSLSNVTGFALSLGLLLGTKTVALPYAALLFLPFLYLAISNQTNFKKRYFLVACVLIIILGGFSYIRNTVLTGNPLYPMTYKVFGKTIFKGVMDVSIYGAHFEAKDYSLGKILFHEGLGAQSLLFILPGCLLALPVSLIKKKIGRNALLLYILALPLFLSLVWRFLIPLANIRYLYPMLGIGMVVSFYCLKALNIPMRIIKVLVVICVIASIPELAKRQELVAGMIMCAVLFIIISLRAQRLPLILALYFGFFALVWLNYDYNKNEYSRYNKMVRYSGFWPQATQAWEWLDSNTFGNNIAYCGRPVPFPLYGTGFKNNVYYVSVNRIDPARLEYYPEAHYSWGRDFLELHNNLEQKGNYRGDANYGVWLGNLLRRKTDYLFVYSLHQTREIVFPGEDSWARIHPDRFTLVYSNDIVHIYKIL